jgi:hypothetical protein
VVQNNVPVVRLGTATSNLTFFQQVGGTVGLALVGTIFASSLAEELPRQLASAGVPPEVGGALAGGGGGGLNALTGVGDLGAAILAAIPEAARSQVEPFVPAIVDAIYQAFSIATANTFLLGIGAALIAAGAVLLLREAPARATEPAAAGEPVATATTERTPSAS